MIILKFFKSLDRYLVDSDYKVTISNGWIHIINYLGIEDFSSTRVVVSYEGGKTILLGNDLVVSKMLEDELLITGKLNSIEYN